MARFSEETIQQVAAANDIVGVIEGYFPLKRAGTTFKALCPFHQERSPSFTVNPARQIFKCFGCGVGGSVFRFVMEYEHLDFSAAVRKLAERAGIRIEQESLSKEDLQKQDLRRRLLELHHEAASFFHKNLLHSHEAKAARTYLKNRGINSQIASQWQIGFAPDSWDLTLRWATEHGFSREEILASGLVTQKDPEQSGSSIYDRFRGRVMFPICNDTGEVIAFSGRVLEADAKAAKYVNSPETILFTKGAVLFGLHRSKRALIEKKSAIVCEGQIDLITAFESGVQNVIAPQGTAFTPKQARILRRYVDEVVLCFDSDAAGEKASERSLPSLLAERLSVRVAKMPGGQDPDSLIREQGPDAFRRVIEEASDFFVHQIRAFSSKTASPREKSEAARKLAGFLALISDPILRDAQIQQVASGLGVAAAEILKAVKQSVASAPSATSALDEKQTSGRARTEAVSRSAQDPTLRLLTTVLLHSAEARQWLLEEDWRERLESEPEAEVVLVLLKNAHRLDEPTAAAGFLSGENPVDEAVFSELLSEKSPENPLLVVQDCWAELERRQIRRRIEGLKAEQREGGLTFERIAAIHQQILDLQRRLLDISRPFSTGR